MAWKVGKYTAYIVYDEDDTANGEMYAFEPQSNTVHPNWAESQEWFGTPLKAYREAQRICRTLNSE